MAPAVRQYSRPAAPSGGGRTGPGERRRGELVHHRPHSRHPDRRPLHLGHRRRADHLVARRRLLPGRPTRAGRDATTGSSGRRRPLLLFVSVLFHELCHSFVAQARGLAVKSITLFIFGGVSNIAQDSEDPQDEFLIAVVGPLSSLALAGLFWLGAAGDPERHQPARRPAVSTSAMVNLMLAVFNILPGFPLDGGRVLRAILWGTTGSMVRAPHRRHRVGQVRGVPLHRLRHLADLHRAAISSAASGSASSAGSSTAPPRRPAARSRSRRGFAASGSPA